MSGSVQAAESADCVQQGGHLPCVDIVVGPWAYSIHGGASKGSSSEEQPLVDSYAKFIEQTVNDYYGRKVVCPGSFTYSSPTPNCLPTLYAGDVEVFTARSWPYSYSQILISGGCTFWVSSAMCIRRDRSPSCPDGYKSTGAFYTERPQKFYCAPTSFVSNTITLTGDSNTTEPWNKKRDAEHTLANLPYKATVKDQSGQPKKDFAVTITTEVTTGDPSKDGGHLHTSGRPKGKLVAGTVVPSTKDGKMEIKGKTNGSGVFEFTFGAEEASGTHTLTAKCDSGCQAAATATVNVEIKGLIILGYDQTCNPAYCLTGGLTGLHTDNHYFSLPAVVQVAKLAVDFLELFGKPLILNDSSLKLGGLYDIKGYWTPSHNGHRKGVVVDVNNFIKRDIDFEELAEGHNITADWEESPPHYHLRLLNNRDE